MVGGDQGMWGVHAKTKTKKRHRSRPRSGSAEEKLPSEQGMPLSAGFDIAHRKTDTPL